MFSHLFSKKGLRAGVVAWLASSSAAWADYRSEVLADNPVAYWRLGEGSGTTAVGEVNSPANDGVYTGGFTLGAVDALAGNTGTAVSFNGGAMQTSGAAGNSIFSGFSVLTMELWIKPNANQGAIHYLEYGLSDFSLESTSLNPNFYVNNIFLGTVALAEGQHSQLVLELNGANANIYKNGALVSSQGFAGTINPGAGAFFLASRNGNSRFVNADIDEISVYHSALGGARVAAHYNAATAVPEPMTTAVATAAGLGV